MKMYFVRICTVICVCQIVFLISVCVAEKSREFIYLLFIFFSLTFLFDFEIICSSAVYCWCAQITLKNHKEKSNDSVTISGFLLIS